MLKVKQPLISKRKPISLWFPNWIKGGITFLRDVRFVNGQVDVQYINAIIIEKGRLFGEIAELKQSLKPYKELLRGYTTTQQMPREIPPLTFNGGTIHNIKSKVFLPGAEEKGIC